MTLRTRLRPARFVGRGWILLVVMLLSVGFWWGLRTASPPQGVPTELAEKQSQLVEMALPPSVDRLDWISSHIEVLNAADCSKVHSLRGLPKSLRELDVSHTAVQSLEFVPRDLRVLDIRETQIAHLAGLPSKLESLKVSGQQISRLGNLPPSLRDLHLSNTKLSDLTG